MNEYNARAMQETTYTPTLPTYVEWNTCPVDTKPNQTDPIKPNRTMNDNYV